MSRRGLVAGREARLLRETEALLLALAACFGGLLAPVHATWKRLARTPAYRRVDGSDAAQEDPIWDAAGSLEMLFERDIRRIVSDLRQDAARIGVDAAQREAEARGGLAPGPRRRSARTGRARGRDVGDDAVAPVNPNEEM